MGLKTMPNYAKFMKLYWTDLITGGAKFVVDPVRVEFFQGPRSYEVFTPVVPTVVRAGIERTVAANKHMELAAGHFFIEFIARTDESLGRRQYCEDQIDRVVTQLSALLSPALFAQEFWSGWLSDSEHANSDFWLMVAPAVSLDSGPLQNQLTAFQVTVTRDADIDQRFTLMSKLFARAVATSPGEGRFLWLWTVLEVFPMRDLTNIQPITEHLSGVTGHPPAEIKEKLGIGRLYRARCNLVHNGKLPYTREELGGVLNRLEAIALTVLQSLGGLPYTGQLEEHFRKN
jgi:hypothetical protein